MALVMFNIDLLHLPHISRRSWRWCEAQGKVSQWGGVMLLRLIRLRSLNEEVVVGIPTRSSGEKAEVSSLPPVVAGEKRLPVSITLTFGKYWENDKEERAASSGGRA